MVMEQLVNGTPPTAIPANIASDSAYLVPFLETRVPSVFFCRRMRRELRAVTETLAALRVAQSGKWRQLFTDGTSRRQTALLTTIIAIDGDDGQLIPIVMRAAFVVEAETSQQQVADILDKVVRRGALRLERLREAFESLFPNVPHSIPAAGELTISKLGGGGAITSDNCNGALKVKELMVKAVKQEVEKEARARGTWDTLSESEKAAELLVLEVHCWNHLRNVWLGGISGALSARLKDKLKDELDEIDSRLRVGTGMESLLRAADKEFSLCANYPKGHGDLFKEWVQRCHPRELLLHVERTAGSRQDLAFEGAGPVYLNRALWVEFLNERLRVPSAENILQENLFVCLTSSELVASMRIHSIFFLAVVLPLRWLADNSRLLAEYDWSVRSMSRTVNMLETAMEAVVADGARIINENYMMGIFSELRSELPPFESYYVYMFSTKAMQLAGSSVREHHMARLREELFAPRCEVNKDTDQMCAELGIVAAEACLAELRDPKKATARHLASADGEMAWGNTSEAEHAAALGKLATNDPAESAFDAITQELSSFGRIAFSSTSGVAQARRNRDFFRGAVPTEARKKRMPAASPTSSFTASSSGLFHTLSLEMREAVITLAARDFDREAQIDRDDLAAQREARRRRTELAQQAGIDKAKEGYIDALYYHEKWGSAACWQTAAQADAELQKRSSRTAKLAALKEQIRIRLLGLGWADFTTHWSREGRERPVAELQTHLKAIIRAQNERDIPAAPPVPALDRKLLPALGKRTADVALLDRSQTATSDAIESAARATKATRESQGIGDSAQERQPSRPQLDAAMVGKRLEVLTKYVLPDGSHELLWCPCKILFVSDGKNMVPRSKWEVGKAAMVLWDANAHHDEEASEGKVRLLPTNWNKDCEGAWRFDLG